MEQVEVLVIGAGPAGGTIAYILKRYGINVKIIEKRPEDYFIGTRAQAIQPPTLQTFDRLGLLPSFRHQLGEVKLARFYKAGSIEPFQEFPFTGPSVPTTPDAPYTDSSMFAQPLLERMLWNSLAQVQVRIDWQNELVSLESGENATSIATVIDQPSGKHYKIAATYVIGCDGARSSVRKAAGLHLEGDVLDSKEGCIADADIESRIDFTDGKFHMFVNDDMPGAVTFISKLPHLGTHNHSSISVFGCPTELVEEAAFRDQHDSAENRDHNLKALRVLLHKCTGLSEENLVITKCHFASRWRASARLANHFSSKNIFIAGDAAHCHPPHGAQGMNTSITDASNLAWKLAFVLKGIISPKVLESYDEERRPVVAAMLRLTAKIFEEDSKKKDSDSRSNKGRANAQVRQLGINYRGHSSITINDPANIITASAADLTPDPAGLVEVAYAPVEGAAAGVRSCDSPITHLDTGDRKTIYDLLRGVKHTVLIFATQPIPLERAEGAPEVCQFVQKLGGQELVDVAVIFSTAQAASPAGEKRYVDTEKWAFKTYFPHRLQEGGVVVIRPDGFLGAVFDNVSKLSKYIALLV